MTPFLFTCPICQTEICERSRPDTARCVDGCFDLTGSELRGFRTSLTVWSPFMRLTMNNNTLHFDDEWDREIHGVHGVKSEVWVESILHQMVVALVMKA